MNPEWLIAHFDCLSEAPDAIPRLRQFILDLAVRGKLVEQNPSDEPVSQLIARIQTDDAGLTNQVAKKERQSSIVRLDETPFVIPSSWRWVRLGERLELINGRAFKPTDWIPEGLPIVRIQNLNNDSAPFNYCDELTVEHRHIIQSGSFLISWSGTPGTSFGAFIWQRGKAALNQHIFSCFQRGEVYFDRFLQLGINGRLDEMIAKAHGGVGLQHITKSKLEHLPLPVPPLPEQRRIVAKVDELMALCDRLEAAQQERESRRDRLTAASLNRLNNGANAEEFREHAHFYLNHLPRLTTSPEQVKQLRQTTLNLAVRGRLVLQHPNDEPAGQFLGDRRLFLDSEAEPWKLPRGWAWASFDLIGETLGGGTPSKADSEFWNGSIPWVSPKDMKVDVIRDAQDHISTSAVEHSATRLIPAGALLMVVRGMILAHSFPTAITALPVTINQDMKAIAPFRPDLIRFLFLLTKGLKPEVLRLVLRSTHGTCKLLTDDLFSLPIPIPPIAEQCRIVAKVDEVMALCDRLEAQLATAQADNRRLLDAVLHEALNGRSADDGQRSNRRAS
jgi:type I restriction enzyme S subunit